MHSLQEFTIKERIKAYVYFGVDAEMDMIASRVEYERSDKSDNDKSYLVREQEAFDRKIAYANKRIDDLQVRMGVG